MKPVLFSLGPLDVHGYGLMIAIGLYLCITLAEKDAPRKGLDKEMVFPLLMFCILGGLVGAKVLFWITILDEIIANPAVLLDLSGGFVVYGAIIGAVVTAYIFCKVKKLDLLDYLDLIIPFAALAQAIGRIGCFLAGCCYGIEYSGFGAVHFPAGGLAPTNVTLLPTQLIYSAANFVHFFILLTLSRKITKKGVLFSTYLVIYSIGRYILEFIRGDLIRGSVGKFSTSQFISLFIFVFGVVGLSVLSKRKEVVKEKSCGAVVYLDSELGRLFLVEKMVQGHYAMCKGHVEDNETEEETTLREIKEETGLDVIVDTSFREVISYSPVENHIKDVIYFVAKAENTDTVNQIEEVSSISWMSYEDAYEVLTYDSDKEILKKAKEYLDNK